MTRRSLVPLLLLLATAASAVATTFAPMTDEALFDRAVAVAEVTVLSVEPAPAEGPPSTDYLVEVDRLLAGELPGSAVVVRVLGGERADGMSLRIWGAPRFAPGERALLFLSPHDDGTYRVEQFLLGAFHRAETSRGPLAVRDLREATVFEGGQGELELRDWGRFSSWLADRGAGIRREADYLSRYEPSGLSSIFDQFTFFESGGKNLRWFEFDSGGRVDFRAHAGGQDGLTGGGFSEFQRALADWTNDAGSNVEYRYAGTTGATNGLSNFDAVNAILFDDLGGEIDGSFQCGEGGTLAIGGPWFDPGVTASFQGESFVIIQGGDVVIQDGLDCFFQSSSDASAVAEELFAHELGHTLGLGHSSERPGESNATLKEALMYFRIHDDGRGGQLNSDDRAGIAHLYPAGVGPSLPAPTNLTASLSGLTSSLAWRDNSTTEEGFRIYRRRDTGTFALLASTSANATTFDDTTLEVGHSYAYRVSAFEGNTESSFSNIASVTTDCVPPGAPLSASALPLSATSLRVEWEDGSADETGFQIETRPDGASEFTVAATTPADTVSAIVGDLLPETGYDLRISALGLSGCTSEYAETHGWTPSDDPNPPSAPDQLLAIVRDEETVFLTWRDNSANELEFVVERAVGGEVPGPFEEVTTLPLDGSVTTPGIEIDGHGAGTQHLYRVRARGVGGLSDASEEVPVQIPAPTGDCLATGTTACLLGDRFQVDVHWRNHHGDNVTGDPVAIGDLGNRTASFAFFNPDVVDLIVKVLDGTPVTGHYWVFFASLSDVEYWVTVTDTATGQVASYTNPPGEFCGQQHTDAIPGSQAAVGSSSAPSTATPQEGSCVADDETLCLLDGRFQLRVSWADEAGSAGAGVGTPIPDTEDSGFFWFFSPDNTELAVKIIDGRSFNGHFWVFYGALSNVHYEIEVTDTVDQTTHSYLNPQGTSCGQADVEAF